MTSTATPPERCRFFRFPLLFRFSLLGLLAALPACVSQVPLEDLPCPCATGWTCCSDRNVCVAEGASCPSLQVTPPVAQVRFGGTLALRASEPVTWSVEEGADAGSVSPDGTYHAPLLRGPFHVIATSLGQPDQRARVEVTVGPARLDLFAGHLGGSGNADGLGTDARFGSLGELVGDGQDTLFVLDGGNQAVRKIDTASGQVTTLVRIPSSDRFLAHLAFDARSGLFALSKPRDTAPPGEDQLVAIDPATGATRVSDAVPRAALFSSVRGLAVDGDYLYEIDERQLFRRPLAGGAWQLVSGARTAGTDDGVGEAVRFGTLQAMVPDPKGGFRLLDCVPSGAPKPGIPDVCIVRAYDPVRTAVTTLQGVSDSRGNLARGTRRLAIEQGYSYVVNGQAIWSVTALSAIGNWSNDSLAGYASSPDAIWAQGGSIYIADAPNGLIRRFGPLSAGRPLPRTSFKTVAGTRPQWGELDGMGTDARFYAPKQLAADGAGGVILLSNGRIRRLDAQGKVATLGGWDAGGFSVDAGQLVYSSPRINYVTRYDLETGDGRVLAGDYMSGAGDRDGVRFAAAFNQPAGLAGDGAGTVYVADLGNGSVRRLVIDTETVTTLARGFVAPFTVAAGGGEVFVAEKTAIRRIRTDTGEVRTLSGAEAGWREISAIAHDPAGILYVSDLADERVRAVNLQSGQVFDVVGRSGVAGVRLGALPASVNAPSGLAVLPSGELAIGSAAEHSILIAR